MTPSAAPLTLHGSAEVTTATIGARPSLIVNFFLVGAPKCGTTALYSYLSQHPSLHLSDIKEPHYFSHDLAGIRRVHEWSAYAALFSGAPPGTCVGEASASYLYSKCAIPEAMAEYPNARVVAILRNPIDAAHAFHSERLFNLNENVANFMEAWALQGARAQGSSIPPHCREPALLQYRNVFSYAKQIERLMKHVPPAQRLLLVSEEFLEAPLDHYRRTLDFLGVANDGRAHFPLVNRNKVLINRSAAIWTRRIRRFFKETGLYTPAKSVSDAFNLRPAKKLASWYVRQRSRSELDPAHRRQLASEFEPDVRHLEEILGRRLDCWQDFGLPRLEGLSSKKTMTRRQPNVAT